MRYSDFTFGFDSKGGKIAVFKESKLNEISESEVKNKILILIKSVSDSETKEV